jgi:hypothetical protein
MTMTIDVPTDTNNVGDDITERITTRRLELQAALDALVADDQLPASATRSDLLAHQQRRLTLQQRLTRLNDAAAAWQASRVNEADVRWRDHLVAWRQTLVDERLQIKSPIRNPVLKGREQNLALSLRTIDRGLRALADAAYSLVTLRLGELMIASGYDIEGADPSVNYLGQLPWRGSLSDVEARLAKAASTRASVDTALADTLLSDDDRAARDADANARRAAFNGMYIKGSPNGRTLIAYRSRQAFIEGLPLTPAEMTPLEREVFEAACASYAPKVTNSIDVSSG